MVWDEEEGAKTTDRERDIVCFPGSQIEIV
jgi:hypothetical protein